MPINVKDAGGVTVSIETPNANGRTAAAGARPVVLATEDKAALDLLAAGRAPAGTSAATADAIQGVNGGVPVAVNPVIRGVAATNRGASVGTTSTLLIPADSARRGFQVQNQSATATVYINGTGAATADFNSLMIPPGAYFEPQSHVGTGDVFVIATAAATPVFARSW